MARTDSWDKIRLKGGPKEYKTGPGVSGRERLERSCRSLIVQANRFAKGNVRQRTVPSPEDAAWAQTLVKALQTVLGLP
jgi:hypothetical protein